MADKGGTGHFSTKKTIGAEKKGKKLCVNAKGRVTKTNLEEGGRKKEKEESAKRLACARLKERRYSGRGEGSRPGKERKTFARVQGGKRGHARKRLPVTQFGEGKKKKDHRGKKGGNRIFSKKGLLSRMK